MMENRKILKSGEFLVSETDPKDVFIPEEFNEEQQMIAQTCRDFLEAEVYPNMTELEKGDRELMKSILKKSGELGLMGISSSRGVRRIRTVICYPDACSGNDWRRIFIFRCIHGPLRNRHNAR